MIHFEKIVRSSPICLMILAVMEVGYRVFNFRVFWKAWDKTYFSAMDENTHRDYLLGLLDQIYSLIIYPVGWIASAITLHLLIAIYDRRAQHHA